MKRYGVTLVETIVIVAIILIVLGLLLPAIQQVRILQTKLEINSKLKSICFAFQHYATTHSGALPSVDKANASNPGDKTPLWEYVKFIEPEKAVAQRSSKVPVVDTYVSPADNSLSEYSKLYPIASGSMSTYEDGGVCSFATNTLVHINRSRMSNAVPDGMSNTIYVAEHNFVTPGPGIALFNSYSARMVILDMQNGQMGVQLTEKYAGFANAALKDVYPITEGLPPVTRPSVPGVTFQHRPGLMQAQSGLLQSTLPFGLLVGMCDGSTRCISPNVSPEVFWSTVTPSGKETVRVDLE